LAQAQVTFSLVWIQRPPLQAGSATGMAETAAATFPGPPLQQRCFQTNGFRRQTTESSEGRTSSDPDAHQKALAVQGSFKRPAVWVLVFGWFLAICAGFVNAVSFRTWGLYVSHVTGSTTAIGLRIAEIGELGDTLWLVFAFLVGAFACGLLIDRNTMHFLGKAFYGAALVGNSLLLVAATFASSRLASACFAAAASGLQNAMCTSHFGAVVRTTHVTGTVTDIGSTLGRMAMIFVRNGCTPSRLNVLEKAEVGVDARKLLVLLPMWCSFLTGCIAGAYAENGLRQYAFLLPAGFTFLLGSCYLLLRQVLKDFLKRLAKQDLQSGVQDVQDAFAHAHTSLETMQSQIALSASANIAGADDESVVIQLSEEMGHIMTALHDVEAGVANLRNSCMIIVDSTAPKVDQS